MEFTLRDISRWTNNNSKVLIPAIQRGLVWKPRQVELLWDSILRGFPIGSFMLADIKDEPGYYDLLDGQQRYNAISLGYNATSDSNAIIWIDVNPTIKENSTRKFLIRVTNTSHPWGFKDDDLCSPLNTAERREALEIFELKGSIYNNSFSLYETWPYKANFPIPLHWAVNASKENSELFLKDIEHALKNSVMAISKKFRLDEKCKDYICSTLYPAMLRVDEYRVYCNHLSSDVICNETQDNTDDKTSLEVLFERINVNGTRISQEDLQYSSIKAYWKNIRDINDRLAAKYMNPSKLVMLAFRMALTDANSKRLHESLSVKQIRSLAKDEKKRSIIDEVYSSGRLAEIFEKVDEWLGVLENDIKHTPALFRTSMAYKTPELYLLLMYWARLFFEGDNTLQLTPNQIRAFAFTVRWFSYDYKKVINEVFYRCQCEGVISIHQISKSIMRCMCDCTMLHIYNPEELSKFLFITDSPKWNPWSNNCGPWEDFLRRIMLPYCSNDVVCEILLYAQRGYINSHFANYDPARQDMWENYNQPWDYDHIVARNRIDNKRGDYREYNKIWLNTIGNIAAISYESNRGKGDREVYDEYYANIDNLMFDKSIESLTTYDFTSSKDESLLFAQSSWKRLNRIYSEVYELMAPVLCSLELSDSLQRRKDIMSEICNKFPEAKLYFIAGNQKDYFVEREQDWSRQWLYVAIEIGVYSVCFVWTAERNGEDIRNAEIGIRKAPNTEIIPELADNIFDITELSNYNRSRNQWWYAMRNLHELEVNQIIEELNDLIQITKSLSQS